MISQMTKGWGIEDIVEIEKKSSFYWYFIQIDQISEISNQMFWPWMLSQIWKYEKEKAYLFMEVLNRTNKLVRIAN